MNNVRQTIGWCDYTINPVKGLCPVGCSYCYARRMYKRFRWNPEIRFESPYLFDLDDRNPSTVFVGSTMELFGEWVKPEWMHTIINTCRDFKAHTFIFLTKKPENLIRFSPFPQNCYVGVSVTHNNQLADALKYLKQIQSTVKFISFEPLLGQIGMDELRSLSKISGWWIIGLQTPYSSNTAPRIEWIKEIVNSADKAGIPVFLKNNLLNILISNRFSAEIPCWSGKGQYGHYDLRQEFPSGKRKC